MAAGVARPAGREIYPEPAQARADLAAALKKAPVEHKRILLDFGGNWCPDCVVLDRYLHAKGNREILEAGFLLVEINIGHYDENLDLAEKYQIPLDRGVPAMAVLTEQGKLLYSQKDGQFERMRTIEMGDVTRFLDQWRPLKPGCSVVAVNC